MTIAIDASRALEARRTGPASYAYHVLQAMQAATPAGTSVRLLAPRHSEREVTDLPPGWELRRLRWWIPGFSSLRVPLHLWANRYDLYFQPAAGIGLVPPHPPTVTTLHDVAFLQVPHLYSRGDLALQRRALGEAKSAAHIITVSEYSKRQLVELAKFKEEKITVIPLAADASMRPITDPAVIEAARHRYGIGPRYFMTVGRVELKKGIGELVNAFNQFNDNEVQLVIVGPPGFGREEIARLLRERRLEGRVKMLGWVEEHDVAALLSGAQAYVSACRYEGFGIAILNAMACGCPVVAFRAGAIPEVAGEAAVLADPAKSEELLGGLHIFLDHRERRDEYSRRAQARAAQFSWRITAEQTWDVLGKVVS